jgi:hypothetical protein
MADSGGGKRALADLAVHPFWRPMQKLTQSRTATDSGLTPRIRRSAPGLIALTRPMIPRPTVQSLGHSRPRRRPVALLPTLLGMGSVEKYHTDEVVADVLTGHAAPRPRTAKYGKRGQIYFFDTSASSSPAGRPGPLLSTRVPVSCSTSGMKASDPVSWLRWTAVRRKSI